MGPFPGPVPVPVMVPVLVLVLVLTPVLAQAQFPVRDLVPAKSNFDLCFFLKTIPRN